MKVYVLLIDSANDGPSVSIYATLELAKKGLRDYLSSNYTQEDIDCATEHALIEDYYARIGDEEDVFQIEEHTIITGEEEL